MTYRFTDFFADIMPGIAIIVLGALLALPSLLFNVPSVITFLTASGGGGLIGAGCLILLRDIYFGLDALISSAQ